MKTLLKEIRAALRNYRLFKSFSENEFSRNGFVIQENVLTKEECDGILASLSEYDLSKSNLIKDECFVMKRGEIQSFDKNVIQIMNIDQINEPVRAAIQRLGLEGKLAELTGHRFKLITSTLQIDYRDTTSKRGYHVDAFNEPWFKAFIYLNDVQELGDGPFTIIPGSHLNIGKIIANILWNNFRVLFRRARTENRDDMNLFFDDRRAETCFGSAGTLIIANVSCVHKGWKHQDRQDRHTLTLLATPEKYACLRKDALSAKVKLRKYGIQVS